jgi:hypothetical protein
LHSNPHWQIAIQLKGGLGLIHISKNWWIKWKHKTKKKFL